MPAMLDRTSGTATWGTGISAMLTSVTRTADMRTRPPATELRVGLEAW